MSILYFPGESGTKKDPDNSCMVFLYSHKKGSCAGTSNFVTPAESWTIFYFPVQEKHVRSGLPEPGVENTMHEQGMMQQHETLMTEMWEKLNDDQKKTMMKRMIDGKIMMKEGMIKHFQFKIETMKMMKKMLDEC